MRRFKENLQTQYDNWVNGMETAKADGFKVNTNVAAIRDTVNKCLDVIHDAREKLDKVPLHCSKDAFKAIAMPHLNIELNLHDLEQLDYYAQQMPPNIKEYAKRLGQIGELAAVRNELMSVAKGGTEAAKILLNKNFDKLVEMYKEDAVLMGLVKYETREESGLEPGNRMDFHAKAVLDLAKAAKNSDAKLKELADAVKAASSTTRGPSAMSSSTTRRRRWHSGGHV